MAENKEKPYMKLFKNIALIAGLALTLDAAAQQAPLSDRSYTQILSSTDVHGGSQVWKMQNISKVGIPSDKVSTTDCSTEGWMPAIVPGTVLRSLVYNDVYPDPYYGWNNHLTKGAIPDLAYAGRDFYTYWFRTELQFPSSEYKGRNTWLQLDGINYRAEVWLNSTLVSVISGMFYQEIVEITDYIKTDETNVLAIKVYPVDSPGKLMDRRQWGAPDEWHNGGDGEIGRNVTMLMSVGWDFTFHDGIRDRNTGIWKDIKVFTTGEARLSYPFVKSELSHPDYATARETASVEVTNPTMFLADLTVEGEIEGTGIKFSKDVKVERGMTEEVCFTPEEFPQLIIKDPRLWWPVNKGSQELYDITFTVKKDGKVCDTVKSRFGIREITTDWNTPDKSRAFYINGKPIFITGTNWIPEAMCMSDDARMYAEMRYTAMSGLNMIRLWGGGITESDYFYQLCDELGILVWEEFWMTGDTKHPVDLGLHLKNVASAVKRTRSHPSLAFYVCSNESSATTGAKELIQALDGTRAYQMQSECDGIHDGSPYKQVNPMRYYENTASDRGSRVDGFNPEYGTICLPTVECLREIMDEKDLWPINKELWDYRDGNGFFLTTTLFTQMVNEYGESSSIDEFAEKAQMVGAMNYKTLAEVWRYNKLHSGDRYCSGYLFWYHNSPLRQVRGCMWDWSLEPTAALFSYNNATEPLHPQFDYLKNTISVINDRYEQYKGYKVTAELYDLRTRKLWSSEAKVDLPADGAVNDVITVPFPAGITPVHFIKLRLFDDKGQQVGSNFYWRSTNVYEGPKTVTGPTTAGFQAINQLPTVKLSAKCSSAVQDGWNSIDIQLKNRSRSLAFFTRVQLVDEAGKPVRPSYYTNNFLSLLPGESTAINIKTSLEYMPAGKYTVIVGGFHQTEQRFAITVE